MHDRRARSTFYIKSGFPRILKGGLLYLVQSLHFANSEPAPVLGDRLITRSVKARFTAGRKTSRGRSAKKWGKRLGGNGRWQAVSQLWKPAVPTGFEPLSPP